MQNPGVRQGSADWSEQPAGMMRDLHGEVADGGDGGQLDNQAQDLAPGHVLRHAPTTLQTHSLFLIPSLNSSCKHMCEYMCIDNNLITI